MGIVHGIEVDETIPHARRSVAALPGRLSRCRWWQILGASEFIQSTLSRASAKRFAESGVRSRRIRDVYES